MARDAFCATCNKYFAMTLTDFCPLCEMTLRRRDGSLVTSPKHVDGGAIVNRSDTVVANLLNALDAIARAAGKPNQQPYIQGIAEQAIKMAHAEMVRNSDGYLVVDNR